MQKNLRILPHIIVQNYQINMALATITIKNFNFSISTLYPHIISTLYPTLFNYIYNLVILTSNQHIYNKKQLNYQTITIEPIFLLKMKINHTF